MKTIPRILLIVGVLGLIAGLVLYFIGTATTEVKGEPVKLDKATYYTKLSPGFLSASTHYFSQIQVEPTTTTVPNMKYLLALDNGIFQQNYEVSWSQLEIAIRKSKTIDNRISQDEYTALIGQASYTTKMFEVRPQRQVLYLLAGIIALLLSITSYIYLKRLRGTEPLASVPFPSDVPPATNERPMSSPSDGTIYVSPDGKATFTPPPNDNQTYQTVEPVEPIDTGEFIRPPSVFEQGRDFLSNASKRNESTNQDTTKKANPWNDTAASQMKRQVDDLVKDGKLTPTEGIKYRQEIEDTKNNPHFFDDTMHRLWSVGQRHKK